MNDRPTLLQLAEFLTIPNLAAHAFIRLLDAMYGPDPFSYLTELFIGVAVILVIGEKLAIELDDYQKMNRDEPRKAVEPKPAPDGWKPRIFVDGKPMYAFQTPVVKIDVMSRKIKHFCIVLVNQREHGFKIDLKEETWKKHFGGREHYVYVRDVRLSGAFAKESGRTNSPFVVIDWAVVESAAKGRLP